MASTPSQGFQLEPRFIDIAVNLTDPTFQGVYYGKRKHDNDLKDVLNRSLTAGVKSLIITGTSLSESLQAIDLAKQHDLYATVGCHPTRSTEFDRYHDGPGGYLRELDDLIRNNLKGKGRVVAIGECGLDYDRTKFALPEIQKTYFRLQLSLAKKYSLPLFLHCRSAYSDFVGILREEGFGECGGVKAGAKGGVVHSFTGTIEEARELTKMGFYIGINGCSMKTRENLQAIATIKPEFLMFETDAPWCSITSTHASQKYLESLPPSLHSVYFPQAQKAEKFSPGSAVKGRNEPVSIGAVAWVIHQLLEQPLISITERVWQNTVTLFGLDESLLSVAR